jgi:hypothetical protein
MQSDLWSWLFRRVPAEQHNQLTIVTGSGIEIAVQVLLRVEPELVAIKGRLAGSQEAGRVFFIPFANIDYFGFQRDVKEAEFDAMFGTGPLTAACGSTGSGIRPAVAPPPVASEPQHDASPTSAASQKTPLPLKSEVLERFRSRIGGTSGSNNGTSFRPER